MQFLNFFLTLLALALSVHGNNWSTYPQVPKTASINGFADPIYSKLPSCAKDSVKIDVGITPCPYWDTGCFCVMPQFGGQVAEYIASSCGASDVQVATSLAYSLCSSVGANMWMMPASVSTKLSKAAKNKATDVSSASAKATASSKDSSASEDASAHTESKLTSTNNQAKATHSDSDSTSSASAASAAESTSSSGSDAGSLRSYTLLLFLVPLLSLV